MVMTDPIADFLTRIRNANQAKHEVLEVPASNIRKRYCYNPKKRRFCKKRWNLSKMTNKVSSAYSCKYGQNGESVITNLKRSQNQVFVFTQNDEDVPKVLNGLGIAIISDIRRPFD